MNRNIEIVNESDINPLKMIITNLIANKCKESKKNFVYDDFDFNISIRRNVYNIKAKHLSDSSDWSPTENNGFQVDEYSYYLVNVSCPLDKDDPELNFKFSIDIKDTYISKEVERKEQFIVLE